MAGTADKRFSITVSRLNSLASWKVRTSPSRARGNAGLEVMSCPRPPKSRTKLTASSTTGRACPALTAAAGRSLTATVGECSAGSAMTRLRSGSTPCGRNHRNTRMSRPIATHSSDGIRFGGRLFEVGMNRVTSSNPTGTSTAPSSAPRWLPVPPMITAANSTTVSA